MYYAGIDVGTSYTKAVVIDDKREAVGTFVGRSGADLKGSIDSTIDGALTMAGVNKEAIVHTISTGFGRGNVTFADSTRTEISCHAKGAYHYFPRKLTIIDIGGQDTKIIRVDEKGKVRGFKMNRKCAAGTGTFLEEIGRRLNVPIEEINARATRSTRDAPLGSFCTVFAATEVLTRIKAGESVEDMLRSAFESVARRVLEMGVFEGTIVMTGGVVAYNRILVDIMRKLVGTEILTPPNPQLTGALGAALFAREM
jgi:predicted CoA-substrate-specific enzyme activase